MAVGEQKTTLSVIRAYSLRELIEAVNHYNQTSDTPILKDDIVSLYKDNETYFLLYYK